MRNTHGALAMTAAALAYGAVVVGCTATGAEASDNAVRAEGR